MAFQQDGQDEPNQHLLASDQWEENERDPPEYTNASVKPFEDETPSRLRDVVILGLAFLMVFSAFTVTQNLASSIFLGSVGFWALGTLYIVFSVVNLFSSNITRGLGLRAALIVGATAYVWYVVANVLTLGYPSQISIQYGIMIPSAALLGFGAATLWTAQGAYVTFCADESKLGMYNGVFFMVFTGNQIVGNVGAALLLQNDVETSLVFKILAGVGALGLFVFLLLRRVDRPVEPKDDEVNKTSERCHTVLEVLILMKEPKMLLLTPVIIYSGITQTFFSGNIPLFINDFGHNENTLSVKLYVMAALGLAASISSLVFGKISDRSGRLPLLALAAVFQLTAYFLLFLLSPINRLDVLIPCAVLLGMGDALINTQVYGILGFLFRESSEAAFATFKFYQSFATGILFFVSDLMVGSTDGCPDDKCPIMLIWMPILLVGLVAAALGLLILRRRKISLDAVSRY